MNANVESLMSAFHIAYVTCLVLAIICLVATVAIFFSFRIRTVIAELSGRAEREAIERMGNEESTQVKRRVGAGLSGKIGSGRMTSGSIGGKRNKQRESGLTLTDRIQVPKSSETNLLDGKDSQAVQLTRQGMSNELPRSGTIKKVQSTSNEFTVTKDVVITHTQETI